MWKEGRAASASCCLPCVGGHLLGIHKWNTGESAGSIRYSHDGCPWHHLGCWSAARDGHPPCFMLYVQYSDQSRSSANESRTAFLVYSPKAAIRASCLYPAVLHDGLIIPTQWIHILGRTFQRRQGKCRLLAYRTANGPLLLPALHAPI